MSSPSSIETLAVNGVTYYLPKTVDDLSALIATARSENRPISLRGSGHSFPLIPDTEATDACLYVLMAYFDSVSFDDAKKQVTVGGGCHLGLDPYDPTGRSTLENSLFYQLFQHGWAIPEMGGITHQTVGGFLSTGSSGGSLIYSFDEMLVSLTVMTAENPPRLRTFSVDDADPDGFYAAGIGLGLFGFIVSATFQCVDTFNIEGTETISTVANCAIDLFASGQNDLRSFMQKTEYTRLIWWPQEYVQKTVVWQAKQIAPVSGFQPKPYQEVPSIFGSNIPASVAADMIYSAIGNWPDWFTDVFNNSEESRLFADLISSQFYPMILPALLSIFVPVDDPKTGPQQFQDYWWSGLCMDNQMNDKLMPVKFTELWIPIERTAEVMNELLDFFGKSGQNTRNTGSFCLELYGAKAGKFWLGPAFSTDVIRIDVFWFANTSRDPVTTLFQHYWDRFAQYDFRCHWGKYLPTSVTGESGAAYLQRQYPKWSAWNALRQQYDPDNVFVTPYWKSRLAL
jgi:D-arabinono-1,4-lactone oxidase/FAD binding domain